MMTELLRIFLLSKHQLIYFFAALAVTSIITSSIALSVLYVGETTESIAGLLPYHLTLIVHSPSENPVKITETLDEKLHGDNRILSYYYASFTAFHRDASNLTIYADNKTLTLPSPRIYVFLLPGIKKNYTIYTYEVWRGDINRTLWPRGEYGKILFNKETSLEDVMVIDMYVMEYYEVFEKDAEQAFQSTVGPVPESTGTIGEYIIVSSNPLPGLVREVAEGWKYGRYGPSASIAIITGSREAFNKLHSYFRDKYGYSTVLVSTVRYGENERMYTQTSVTNAVVCYIRFDPTKVLYTYSVGASQKQLLEYVNQLEVWALSNEYMLDVKEYPLYEILSNLQGAEFMVRLSTITSLLPAFVIVWISASHIPPAVIATMRKEIALLRVRGVSVSRIKKQYLISLLVEVIGGGLVGFFVGPLFAIALYQSTRIDLVRLYSGLMDLASIIGVLLMIIILMYAAIRKSFNIITGIAPIEYTRPTIMAELPLVERGLKRSSILLIILGAYYVARMLGVINPYELMTHGAIDNPFLMIAVIIMFILEPIMVFFGPVILIYAVAKTLIAYPEKLARMISWMGGWLVKEYRALLSRFVYVKPARISLSIIVSSFALSILLFGLLNSFGAQIMFNDLAATATGDVDYVAYRYVNLLHDSDLEMVAAQYYSNISSYINGSATYMFYYLGEYPLIVGAYTTSIVIFNGTASIPLGCPLVIGGFYKVDLFLVPGNYMEMIRITDNLVLDGDKEAVFKALSSGDQSAALYVRGRYGPEKPWISVREREREQYIGFDKVLVLRNLPAPAALYYPVSRITGSYSTTSISFAPGASIPIRSYTGTAIIAHTSLYHRIAENLRENTTSYFLLIFLVRGSINETGIRSAGFTVRSVATEREAILNAGKYFKMSYDVNTATGVSLFIISAILIALLSYTLVYENLFTYTILRGRGVSSSIIYRLALSEALSISLFGILPGVLIGLLLAYGAPRMALTSLTYESSMLFQAYGFTYGLYFHPFMIVYIIGIPLILVAVSWIIIRYMYRRVAHEALQVIGGHV